jgi:hypothetical protein
MEGLSSNRYIELVEMIDFLASSCFAFLGKFYLAES